MTLNDLERHNGGFYGFLGDFGLQHKSISFTRWRHVTIVNIVVQIENLVFVY